MSEMLLYVFIGILLALSVEHLIKSIIFHFIPLDYFKNNEGNKAVKEVKGDEKNPDGTKKI
jgi:hypothetical protein